MKIRYSLPLLFIPLVVLLSGCDSDVTYKHGKTTPLTAQKLDTARQVVTNGFLGDSVHKPALGTFSAGGGRHQIVKVDISGSILAMIDVGEPNPSHICRFTSISDIVVSPEPITGWWIELPGCGLFRFPGSKKARVQSIAQAIATLRYAAQHPLAPNQDPHFQKIVAVYREANPKPALPENVRRYEIEAQDAINSENYVDAVELYARGLEEAPWWPQGHYNRAMLFGEMKDYAHAIVEMQRYLALVPDAPNARASQDRIYIWEHRESLAMPDNGGQDQMK